MSRRVLYQWTQAEVMSSRSARVRIGPRRNGEPSRTHSVLYRPIVVSARALVCPEGSWKGSDVEGRAIDSDHAVAEMEVGPSASACRCWCQTTTSCCGE